MLRIITEMLQIQYIGRRGTFGQARPRVGRGPPRHIHPCIYILRARGELEAGPYTRVKRAGSWPLCARDELEVLGVTHLRKRRNLRHRRRIL